MILLLCLLTASLAETHAGNLQDHRQAKITVDQALEHKSDVHYYNDTSRRYPHQMDEYDAALNLLIEVTPITPTNSSLRSFRTSAAGNSGVCSPDAAACSSTDSCCQGGCTSRGKCQCQAQNEWCFNYGGPDSFCCSNMCGVNGLCSCIPNGKSCAVGGEHCCNGLICGSDLVCREKTPQPSSDKPTVRPTQNNIRSNEELTSCTDGKSKVVVEITTGERFL